MVLIIIAASHLKCGSLTEKLEFLK